MTRKEHSPHKRLLSEWTDRSVLFVGGILVCSGLGIVYILRHYPSDAAIVMWIVTWTSLSFFLLWRMKTSGSDPGYRVDNKVIDETRMEIDAGRRRARKELLENELKVLCRGEKTAVLDIWRLDQSLARRHRFISCTSSLFIDPKLRELQIRIQEKELCREEDRKIYFGVLWRDLVAYLNMISQDAYLHLERGFFDHVVIVVDSLHEDDRHMDMPYPMLSLSVGAAQLWSIPTMPWFDVNQLQRSGNMRFDNGNEIEPHRVVDLPAARGSK